MKRFISGLMLLIMTVSVLGGTGVAFGSAGPVGVVANTNGNTAASTYQDGILTAQSSGSGLFAIALYKDRMLRKLSLAQSEEELDEIKLSMIIPDGSGTSMKIFRFMPDGTPYMVNRELTPDNSGNIRIYVNEDFSDGAHYANGTTLKYTNQSLEFDAVKGQTPRANFTANQHGKNVVFEADVTPAEDNGSDGYIRLLNYYYTNTGGQSSATKTLLRLKNGTRVYAGIGGNTATDCHLSSAKSTRLSVVMDFEADSYSLYADGVHVGTYDGCLLNDDIKPGTVYTNRRFFVGYTSGDNDADDPEYDTHLFVDNVKIYEAAAPRDIGSLKPNVHKTDFSSMTIDSPTYVRPTAAALAEGALAAGHPRVLVNKAKINEIKNSVNDDVIAWKADLIKRADEAAGSDVYSYKISNTGSMDDIGESIARMMDLGLAYMLTGEAKYTQQAWKEARVLIDYETEYILADGGTQRFKDWNSRSYLDVGEVSFILAICYDWMYDAWTPAQRKEISDAVLNNSIELTYNIYHGLPIADDAIKSDCDKTYTTWYDSKSNWNAVCNGGVFTAAMAFMEADAFKCATVAEAAMRGLEYMMEIYYPGGAWNEGPSYWAYALKYLTIALATMEISCTSHYGIPDATGFRETPLYSMALEGQTGVAGFGDVNGDRIKAPMLFYWSRVFDEPKYTAAAFYGLNNFGFKADAFDLVYFDPKMDEGTYTAPAAYNFENETVSFNSPEGFIAITGGRGKQSNHDHLDSGSVIVDLGGNRVLGDIGAEHYGVNDYFGAGRFLYFRTRPEAHNIFIINPETDPGTYYGQNPDAESLVTSYDKDAHTATMDLSSAYSRDARNSQREIKLDGGRVTITDTITGLRGTANSLYWNWYVKYADEDTRHNPISFGDVQLGQDGRSVIISLNGQAYTMSFETGSEYTLEITDNPNYYVDVDPDPGFTHKHKNHEYKRIALKIENTAEENITVKTVIEQDR